MRSRGRPCGPRPSRRLATQLAKSCLPSRIGPAGVNAAQGRPPGRGGPSDAVIRCFRWRGRHGGPPGQLDEKPRRHRAHAAVLPVGVHCSADAVFQDHGAGGVGRAGLPLHRRDLPLGAPQDADLHLYGVVDDAQGGVAAAAAARRDLGEACDDAQDGRACVRVHDSGQPDPGRRRQPGGARVPGHLPVQDALHGALLASLPVEGA
eukprot:scaffold81145_cov64-Phaeocystis_antarctica.AAC.5